MSDVISEYQKWKQQGDDLRLKAKLPDGSPLELKKEFAVGGLEGVFGGKR